MSDFIESSIPPSMEVIYVHWWKGTLSINLNQFNKSKKGEIMPRTIYFHKMLRGVVINILLPFTLSNDGFSNSVSISGRQLGNCQQ